MKFRKFEGGVVGAVFRARFPGAIPNPWGFDLWYISNQSNPPPSLAGGFDV